MFCLLLKKVSQVNLFSIEIAPKRHFQFPLSLTGWYRKRSQYTVNFLYRLGRVTNVQVVTLPKLLFYSANSSRPASYIAV